jgi:acyl carrier protein phosphodiesterase
MNKRIDKLIDDARLTAVAEMFEVELTKFAELIVQECANHCDLLLDHKISSEWSRGTHDCSRAIKKHFGVEE